LFFSVAFLDRSRAFTFTVVDGYAIGEFVGDFERRTARFCEIVLGAAILLPGHLFFSVAKTDLPFKAAADRADFGRNQ
jgi:hypothetical protein